MEAVSGYIHKSTGGYPDDRNFEIPNGTDIFYAKSFFGDLELLATVRVGKIHDLKTSIDYENLSEFLKTKNISISEALGMFNGLSLNVDSLRTVPISDYIHRQVYAKREQEKIEREKVAEEQRRLKKEQDARARQIALRLFSSSAIAQMRDLRLNELTIALVANTDNTLKAKHGRKMSIRHFDSTAAKLLRDAGIFSPEQIQLQVTKQGTITGVSRVFRKGPKRPPMWIRPSQRPASGYIV